MIFHKFNTVIKFLWRIFWRRIEYLTTIKHYQAHQGFYSEMLGLIDMTDVSRFGAIAQLVEHLHGMQGVSGSNPLGSI